MEIHWVIFVDVGYCKLAGSLSSSWTSVDSTVLFVHVILSVDEGSIATF